MPSLRGKTWDTTTPATVGDAQYWEDHLISDTDAQKAANSVQSVNGTPPDASGNVDVVALPAGGTTGQVLTKISNTSGDADWLDPASGGHSIQDKNGTTMTQQPNLQFLGADVSNDSVNNRTVVDCKGAKGDAATIAVGTTTTGAAGTSASVTNSGTQSAAVFDFVIPRGADGTNGADGDDGISVTGVTLYATSGKVKTYRMTFSNNTYFDFDVTDGADGTGAGDMLSTDYDPTSAVYNAGGIPDYVSGVLPVITNTYSSTSDDGMSGKAVASALAGLTIPVITNTYSSTSEDGMSGKAVASAISGKADSSSLANVATSGLYSDLSGTPTIPAAQVNADWNASGTVAEILNKPTIPAAQIQSDWNQVDTTAKDYIKNKPSVLGHEMKPDPTSNPTESDVVSWVRGAQSNNEQVPSLYGIQNWSNLDGIKILTQVSEGDDVVGSWNDTWETDGDRQGWIFHKCLYYCLRDDDVDVTPIFVVPEGEHNAVGYVAERIDDEYYKAITTVGTENPKDLGWYESDGQTPPTYTLTNDTTVQAGKTYYERGGAVAIKLNAPIPAELDGIYVGVYMKINRTKTFYV